MSGFEVYLTVWFGALVIVFILALTMSVVKCKVKNRRYRKLHYARYQMLRGNQPEGVANKKYFPKEKRQ